MESVLAITHQELAKKLDAKRSQLLLFLLIKAALVDRKKVVNGSLFSNCIFFCVRLMMSG